MNINQISDLKHFNKYLILSSIIIIGILIILYFPFTADDSYISYRYGYNLVNNGYWNYNPVANPIEAYTNFSYAFISIIPAMLKIPVALFFKLIGLTILFLLIYQLKKICEINSFLLGLIFILCNPTFFIHLFSGLETPLFIFLIFELIYLLNLENKPNTEKFVYLILLLLPLTRPEGILFSIVGFLIYFKKNKITLKMLFLSICVIGLVYFIWRIMYFKEIFPVSFYAKTVSSTYLTNMKGFISDSFKTPLLVSFILFFLIKNKSFKIFLLLSLAIILFLYAPSNLQMNYASRFWFQVLAPIFMSSILFANRSEKRIILILFIFLIFLTNPIENLLGPKKYSFNLNKCHKDIGLRLNRYKNMKYKLLVSDGGILPYYSEWESYDLFYGLNYLPAAKKELKLENIAEINPDLIFLISSSKHPNEISLNFENQKIIYEYIKKTDNYDYISGSKFQSNYYLTAYLKKRILKYEEIKNDLKNNEYSSNQLSFSLKDIISFTY
jgi:hypothetical protein